MKRIIPAILLGFAFSFFVFPVSFTFLPPTLNTKQILGVLGILYYAINCIRQGEIKMDQEVIVSALIAGIFSVWCFFSEIENSTFDGSYSQYIVSFSVWLGGAYGVTQILKAVHGRLTFRILTNYLAAVCVFQCAIALMIRDFPVVKLVVDSIFYQAEDFMSEINRLYGIGAALDPAGMKFSVVLVMMAHLIGHDTKIQSSTAYMLSYIIAFILISYIGNVISRTTSIGMIIGLVYMFVSFGLTDRSGTLKGDQLRFYAIFLSLMAIAVFSGITLYRVNPAFRSDIRFAFEGFFNWAETGVFTTGSTEKLNNVMWIWPDNAHDWIVGTGIFGNFVYSTDIGYCRFTLYCGLVGLAIFSGFFVYNGLSIRDKFYRFDLFCLLLISMTFIFWVKVATDIFLFNALLFCIDGDYDEQGERILDDEEDEDEEEAVEVEAKEAPTT